MSMKKFYTLELLFVILIVLFFIIIPMIKPTDPKAASPLGETAASVENIAAKTAGSPTLDEVAVQVSKNTLGINYVWILLSGCLIFFFQAGFAMVETGLTQAKNALHTMGMNLVVFLVGAIGYYLVGFAVQFGGVGGWASLGAGPGVLDSEFVIPGFGGLFGMKGFGLVTNGTYDVGVYALFFFMMVFMDTTCTIPTGAMAERVKFSSTVVMAFFVSTVYFPLFGNWVWGGGWLATLGSVFGLGHGAVDFAGSSVVHATGGVMALAGAIVIGPRIGKYKKDGTPVAIPGHHIPMAVIGTIILFFGWFVFNAGSTMNGSDLRTAVIVTNTMLAGAAGGLTSMFYTWNKYKKPDISMTCNGALAGLVAITAPCAFVSGPISVLIGVVSGILVCISVYLIEHKFKIDDPVGAASVHAINGMWGMIALGLFADGTYGSGINGVEGGVRGLLYGDAGQFLAQLIAVGVLIVFCFGISWVFFTILKKTMGIRVPAEQEKAGLDMPEMGMYAYPDFQLKNPESHVFNGELNPGYTAAGIKE